MTNKENNFPAYYDGSSHVEFSEEMAGSSDAKPKEAPAQNEEWRRHIGANPFGMNSNS